MPKALVLIEDDVQLHEALKFTVEKELGLKVISFFSAEDFLRELSRISSALYLIDWELPGIKGPDIVRLIRQSDKISPIIMMSGLQETTFASQGLESGADDFLLKPFNFNHLILKLRNAMIRTSSIHGRLMDRGVKLLPEADVVMQNGQKAKLSSREFQVFHFLYSRPGVVHPRGDVVASFKDKTTTERNVDFLIYSLRKKISPIGLEIETVRGRGYKIDDPRTKLISS